jgi:hypothetical protein
MPSWILALILAVGVTAWLYNLLARTNGNANPKGNFIIAAIAGFVLFLVVLSLLKWVLNF